MTAYCNLSRSFWWDRLQHAYFQKPTWSHLHGLIIYLTLREDTVEMWYFQMTLQGWVISCCRVVVIFYKSVHDHFTLITCMTHILHLESWRVKLKSLFVAKYTLIFFLNWHLTVYNIINNVHIYWIDVPRSAILHL